MECLEQMWKLLNMLFDSPAIVFVAGFLAGRLMEKYKNQLAHSTALAVEDHRKQIQISSEVRSERKPIYEEFIRRFGGFNFRSYWLYKRDLNVCKQPIEDYDAVMSYVATKPDAAASLKMSRQVSKKLNAFLVSLSVYPAKDQDFSFALERKRDEIIEIMRQELGIAD